MIKETRWIQISKPMIISANLITSQNKSALSISKQAKVYYPLILAA